MVATVLIRALTGVTPTVTDITSTNLRANSFDTYTTNDTTSPIKVPTSGSNYSYWRATRLDCTVAPVTNIGNLKWYPSAGSNPTGCTYNVGQATSYNAGQTGMGGPFRLPMMNRPEEFEETNINLKIAIRPVMHDDFTGEIKGHVYTTNRYKMGVKAAPFTVEDYDETVKIKPMMREQAEVYIHIQPVLSSGYDIDIKSTGVDLIRLVKEATKILFDEDHTDKE